MHTGGWVLDIHGYRLWAGTKHHHLVIQPLVIQMGHAQVTALHEKHGRDTPTSLTQ